MKLFVRSNHNIILTEDGMILKRRAQEILSFGRQNETGFLAEGRGALRHDFHWQRRSSLDGISGQNHCGIPQEISQCEL